MQTPPPPAAPADVLVEDCLELLQHKASMSLPLLGRRGSAAAGGGDAWQKRYFSLLSSGKLTWAPHPLSAPSASAGRMRTTVLGAKTVVKVCETRESVSRLGLDSGSVESEETVRGWIKDYGIDDKTAGQLVTASQDAQRVAQLPAAPPSLTRARFGLGGATSAEEADSR